MGLFFRKRKEKQNKARIEPVDSAKIFSVEPLTETDMISLIKKEKDSEMLNPFAESSGILDPNLSVAKRYGRKYINSSAKGQLAQTKVVDIRSYVKPIGETTTSKPKTDFELSLDELEKEKDDSKKDEDVLVKPKLSFFDELMKEIDEEIAELEENDESSSLPVKPILPPEPIKKVPAKTSAKKAVKRKKGIDIDIISGDFGGIDIL